MDEARITEIGPNQIPADLKPRYGVLVGGLKITGSGTFSLKDLNVTAIAKFGDNAMISHLAFNEDNSVLLIITKCS